jgi:hypothetical protein
MDRLSKSGRKLPVLCWNDDPSSTWRSAQVLGIANRSFLGMVAPGSSDAMAARFVSHTAFA